MYNYTVHVCITLHFKKIQKKNNKLDYIDVI